MLRVYRCVGGIGPALQLHETLLQRAYYLVLNNDVVYNLDTAGTVAVDAQR